MNTVLEDSLRRHSRLSDRWGSEPEAEQLLGPCKALLLRAQELEAAASTERPLGLDPTVLGCFGAALNSLATVSLLLGQAVDEQVSESAGDEQPDPNRLLFAINQNLRFAAEAAELAQRVLGGTEDDAGQ